MGFWVVAETSGEGVHEASLEALEAARALGDGPGPAAVVLGGPVPEGVPGLLAAHGAGRVLCLEHEALAEWGPGLHAAALTAALAAERPRAVLLAGVRHRLPLGPLTFRREPGGRPAGLRRVSPGDDRRSPGGPRGHHPPPRGHRSRFPGGRPPGGRGASSGPDRRSRAGSPPPPDSPRPAAGGPPGGGADRRGRPGNRRS
ncbi:MAG: hypothetical protein HYV61_05965 [Candidatus Rokubacteria bacterium]|nr:hypothetical protein [Candidatus Rokubacteria bacterium]